MYYCSYYINYSRIFLVGKPNEISCYPGLPPTANFQPYNMKQKSENSLPLLTPVELI